MLILAPWVNHEGGAIYSIDIHPIEDKLATSGQTEGGRDGLVVIWNLKPIKDAEAANDENIPKILAKLDHAAGVNCIRWSVDGKMLACSSDDRSIAIYEFNGRVKSSGRIGSKEKTVENYKIAHTIHSHSMEVLAVAWSPDGKYLASSSMDDTIIIYNARKLPGGFFFSIFKRFPIAFKKLIEEFPEKVAVLDSKRNGHFESVKGLAWDPIGKYLASQSADKTVKIWTTDNWKVEQTITEPYKNSAQNTMFYRLAWSAEGQYLFTPGATNNDGPVAQIIRRKDWDISRDFVGYRKAVTCISVCPRLLNFTDLTGANIRVSLVAIGSRDKSLSVFAYPLVKRPLCVVTNFFKHSVTDLSWRGLELAVSSQDGTMRFLIFKEEHFGEMLSLSEMGSECEKHYKSCPTQFCGEENGLDDSQLDSTFIDTAEQLLAKRNAEEKKSKLAPTAVESQLSAAAIQAKKNAEILAETRKEQINTISDGKRRIQPIFLASTVDDETPVDPKPAEPTPKRPVVVQPVVVKSSSAPCKKEKTRPRSPKQRKIEVSTDDSTASDSSDDEMDTSETDTVNTPTTSEPKKLEGPTTSNLMMAADFKKPTLRPYTLTRITVGEKETILDMPERRSNFTENVLGAPGETITVENEWKCIGVDASRVCFMKGETMSWAVLVDLPVATAAANPIITAVGCFDRSVRIFASSSGRLHCCLQLDSSPVRVGVNQGKVYALTQSGKFSSWDIEKRKSILSRVAVSDCVTKDDHLQSISITAAGLPVLSFSNGDVFTYASDLQCWQLTDSPCSLMKLSRAVDSREIGDGHIGRALNRRRRFGPLPNTPVMVRNSISETQLESWMNCAQSAGSSLDFQKFLISYANILAAHGSQTKIKELLARLEGPGSICSIQKAALRREVEAILKENPSTAPILTKKKSVI